MLAHAYVCVLMSHMLRPQTLGQGFTHIYNKSRGQEAKPHTLTPACSLRTERLPLARKGKSKKVKGKNLLYPYPPSVQELV